LFLLWVLFSRVSDLRNDLLVVRVALSVEETLDCCVVGAVVVMAF
jgi:hypothetical protein